MGRLSIQDAALHNIGDAGGDSSPWRFWEAAFKGEQIGPWRHLWRTAVYFFNSESRFRLVVYALGATLATIVLAGCWLLAVCFRSRSRTEHELLMALEDFPAQEVADGIDENRRELREISGILRMRQTLEANKNSNCQPPLEAEIATVVEPVKEIAAPEGTAAGQSAKEPLKRRVSSAGRDICYPGARGAKRTVTK